MEPIKTIVEILFYSVSVIGVLGALWTYRSNQRLERSRWASALYDKFYDKAELKGVRQTLDCSANSSDVAVLVDREGPEFTDYLNFFEHVAYLVRQKQISQADAEAYFDYYFTCLNRHEAVRAYIRDSAHGFERLKEWLRL